MTVGNGERAVLFRNGQINGRRAADMAVDNGIFTFMVFKKVIPPFCICKVILAAIAGTAVNFAA